MFTENGLLIDLEEVAKVVDGCDVFTIGFRTFPERLIVDTRRTGEEGPMVEVVEPVSTVEERFFWLGKRRPAFGVPERFTFFIWPHSVRFLGESGLADKIREQSNATGCAGASEMVDGAVTDLDRLDRKSTFDAITGRNYHTLWTAAS